MTTVKTIRTTLYNSMNQLSYCMDKGLVFRDVRKYMAIERLKLRFDSIKDKALTMHYRWLLRLRNDVITILPPDTSKFRSQRMKLIQLLDEAEKKLNTDAMRVSIL